MINNDAVDSNHRRQPENMEIKQILTSNPTLRLWSYYTVERGVGASRRFQRDRNVARIRMARQVNNVTFKYPAQSTCTYNRFYIEMVGLKSEACLQPGATAEYNNGRFVCERDHKSRNCLPNC